MNSSEATTSYTSNSYPSKAWLRRALRRALIAGYYGVIFDCFIIGSEATGKATDKSDLDVAVIIPARKNVRSVTVTERYYAKFNGRGPASDPDIYRCRWKGRIIDFQFFYPGEADQFPRIELEESLTSKCSGTLRQRTKRTATGRQAIHRIR